MKHFLKFETHTDFETYIDSSLKILPNLSYCQSEEHTHFSHFIENRIVVYYNVSDGTVPIKLYNWVEEDMGGSNEFYQHGQDVFEKIEIDDVEESITDLDLAEG